MGSAVNGMAAHGGVIPFSATFLVFSDYMRAPIRLAALSGYKSIFVFTHDSIAVGEDGPTHEPVEQVMSLRLIPGLNVIRPADANETREAWQAALTADGPDRARLLPPGPCRSSTAPMRTARSPRAVTSCATPKRPRISCSSPPVPRSRFQWKRPIC